MDITNPYNSSNKLLTDNNVLSIMKDVGITNFTINNLVLYQTAFTHKSYCNIKEYDDFENTCNALPLQNKSYETMEFLGDAVLGSVVSSYLYKRFHEIHSQNEGFLTKLKIRIICGVFLCKLSKDLKFQEHIIISSQTENSPQGRNNENILEDVFEAFVGAIYLDHSYEKAEEFIIHVIETYVDFTDILLTDNNFIDQITRYIKRTFNTYPTYKHEKVDNKYKCNIYVNDKFLCYGIGDSKKKSQQASSKNALIEYNVITK